MKKNPKVDAYILNAASFAQPILNELRATLETAEPQLEETIKWGFPCFTFQSKLICSFSAYKKHCVFSFWQGSNLEESAGILTKVGETEMGELSKIKNLKDLPNSEVLIKYIREAIELSKKKSTKTIASEKKITIDLKSADLPEIFGSFPKQAENVGSGLVTPRSVPANFAVNPDKKKYLVCSGVNLETGGITPKASAVRKITIEA